MKYQLKKDLPFAKAGTGLYTQLVKGSNISSMEGRTKVYIDAETFADQYGSVCLGLLADLLHSGWIESVKPREWYAIMGENYQGKLLTDEEYNRYCLAHNRGKVIKVREVIE